MERFELNATVGRHIGGGGNRRIISHNHGFSLFEVIKSTLAPCGRESMRLSKANYAYERGVELYSESIDVDLNPSPVLQPPSPRWGEGRYRHVEAEPKHRMAVKIEKFNFLKNKNSESVVNYELTNKLDSFATAQNDYNNNSLTKGVGNSFTDTDFSLFTSHFSLKCAVNNQYSKVAFTLAEVLITLGIIGVIAALTLPTLIANKKAKELEVALKKNASILQQAVMLVNLEDGEDLAHTVNEGRTLKDKLKPHLNVLKDCGYGTEISSCVVNTGYDANKDAKNTYRTYNKATTVNYYWLDDGQLLLTDGTLILIEESPGYSGLFISVDINGFQKGPNLWGHDLFTFEITSEGKFLPMGAVGTRYNSNDSCSKTATGNANGIACTYKALTDPNYFKQLP